MAQKSVNNINDLLNSYQLTSYIIDTVIYKGNRHTMPAMNKVLLAEWAGTLRLITCQSRALKGKRKIMCQSRAPKIGCGSVFWSRDHHRFVAVGSHFVGLVPCLPPPPRETPASPPLHSSLSLSLAHPCCSHGSGRPHTSDSETSRSSFCVSGQYIEQKWLPVLTTIPTFLSTS